MESQTLITEDQRIELWRREQFKQLGFEEGALECVMGWGTDLGEARRLFVRDGEPTDCTIAQALRILAPLP